MKICVFGSSSDRIDKIYLQTANSLGKSIALKGYELIFGAGRYGVMGAAARGATECNGKVIGVVPSFFKELDVLYDKSSETIYTETMRERKGIMEDAADAFIICAGGIGTFEEFFEVLTLKQLHRHSKPIIIYNVNGYYDAMLSVMKNAVDERFMTDDCNRLYTVACSEQEVFEQLENYASYSYNKYNYLDWNKGEEDV